MDFSLNDTHTMIRETARKFADERIAPGTIERDEKEEFPREIVGELGELGFMGMMVPEEWGGIGLDTPSYVFALEEISRVDASVGVIMSVNNSLVCYGINKDGSTEQKERYLKDLASGRKLGAFALSEPEAGSDASNQRTIALRDGDRYILNGTKNWITNGSSADIVLVMAATDREKGAKGRKAPRGSPSQRKRENWGYGAPTRSPFHSQIARYLRRTASARKGTVSGLR
jgi:hypothetical protein